MHNVSRRGSHFGVFMHATLPEFHHIRWALLWHPETKKSSLAHCTIEHVYQQCKAVPTPFETAGSWGSVAAEYITPQTCPTGSDEHVTDNQTLVRRSNRIYKVPVERIHTLHCGVG